MEPSAELIAKLERVAAANISILPTQQIPNHIAFERDGFIALVEYRGGRLGTVGAAGVMSEKGFAPLVRRGDASVFVAKGHEQTASAEQVSQLRAFQADLVKALE